MSKLGQFDTALRFKKIIADTALKVIGDERPAPRYGVVGTVNRVANTAQVTYTGESTPVAVPFGWSAVPILGDRVRVEGPRGDRYIAEVLRGTNVADPVIQLANAMVSVNTGGGCKGKWADGSGFGYTNVPVGTTDTDISLGVTNVPVRPNRILRVSLRVLDIDVVTNAYRTTTIYTNWNGAGFGPYRRSTTYANGAGGTSYFGPMFDQWVFATPATASTLSIKTYVNTSSGTAYVYRYASYTGQDESWMTVDDIGSAQDFFDQGGVSG